MVKGFLFVDDKTRSIRYLGYKLKLTPTEYRILRTIIMSEGVSAEDIAENCGLLEKKRNNISVHICSINRKAETIGKRRLILFEKQMYHINEFM